MVYDQPRARVIAAEAMSKAALAKNNPPDLINVALERLIEASLELPGFTTLDEMAARIRARVNAEIFARICERMGPEGRERIGALLTTTGPDGRTLFNRLKKPAQRASWSRFRKQAEYLDEIDALGDTGVWLEGVAPTKIADFRRGGRHSGRRHPVAVRAGQAVGAAGVLGARRADAGPR
ncbi:hypothetical protein GCM10017600_26690 [Streptosporangium carneum]|uniref:Uncharacterized protein n=1 Tax=Streptosporangium carneum TaxID=47481 RepID=A0A9W6I135_9ACTN|nr:hypothetical protein [Streptosporangium carneum]GLK09263.1 hypothetical protein GCM10017600_26690 [Streptosporangium carneum]